MSNHKTPSKVTIEFPDSSTPWVFSPTVRAGAETVVEINTVLADRSDDVEDWNFTATLYRQTP